jgi:hypothetical protein
MSYSVRILPRGEWGKLDGTPLGEVAGSLNSTNVRVAVVEDDAGDIVGTIAAFRVLHVHGLWIKEDHRRSPSIGCRLLLALRRIAKHWGAEVALTERVPDNVADMIGRLGGIPWEGPAFLLPIPERNQCRQP